MFRRLTFGPIRECTNDDAVRMFRYNQRCIEAFMHMFVRFRPERISI